ncbi:hypothetical protein C922_01993 [Plasmodium inui San Antonio 1]|uniref:THIF-type NAD/FAD binding fold domain-containing protein n=1 Tax=Plasmodium inui San Antonio 1 TaxID=1237626 RepID=W7AFH9_9APIC|nr:hypothetical protein C922_01993 [Plasmodium inui San Antonio 1]EUD67804.1 hypothetical protein C922_01993 [Plasmodium inui San Antonio 1]
MEQGEQFRRQISLWGTTHQEILMSSSVCLLGSSLTIMEVAKGLMLSGIRNITIVDNACVTTEDVKYYIFSKGYEIINEYRCKVVKENLMKMNQIANITCLVKDPLKYMNEVDSNGDTYDVIICDLSVKNNLSVERMCRRKCRIIITCHAAGYLGYVHASVGGHLYMQTCGKKSREKSEWGVYTHLSLSLYDELKEYVRGVHYSDLRGRGWRDKIVFLAKCYQDFRARGGGSGEGGSGEGGSGEGGSGEGGSGEGAGGEGGSEKRGSRRRCSGSHWDSSSHICRHSYCECDNRNDCDRPFLTFVTEKLKLKGAPRFPPPDGTSCTMLNPRNVTHRIKEALLRNRTDGSTHNHIFIFLVVLKSFIKYRKELPLLLEMKNEHLDDGGITNCLEKILLNRKVKDEKQIERLIERKKRKYRFRKPFSLSHFVYFFWNFLFIRRVEHRSGTWGSSGGGSSKGGSSKEDNIKRDDSKQSNYLRDNCLGEHFLEFAFLYGLGLKPIREGYLTVCGREGTTPLPFYSHYLKQKTRGSFLLCGRHKNLLHFGERAPNGDIKKESNKRVELYAPHDERDTHMDGYDDAKGMHFLPSYVDSHTDVFFNTVRKVENTFHRLVCDMGGGSVCAKMVIAGLVTQEGVKICSLYMEPQSSYFFFTAGRRRGGVG